MKPLRATEKHQQRVAVDGVLLDDARRQSPSLRRGVLQVAVGVDVKPQPPRPTPARVAFGGSRCGQVFAELTSEEKRRKVRFAFYFGLRVATAVGIKGGLSVN